ncbi:SC6A7-like protein [Mya arenaria]|uniref:Transporter n=1 Tax=Mya arenaria TaxID=6604 RepID=A0ABY7F0Z0_MYAAR|nr:sodium-dependent proline transporter-like [Mya arenaria]WAR15014.1 SC6A7-like protein [Mya arenaria]
MEERARLQWRGRLEFLFTNMGYTVGLGNIWRFPYRCYINGGGAFMIPYLLALILCSFPTLFLEMFLGQIASEGAISIWKICPLLKGVGWAMIFNLLMTNIYYSVIVMYSLFYMTVAFVNIGGPLPWQCANTTEQPELCQNHSTSEHYWNRFVLRVHGEGDNVGRDPKGFDNLGAVVGRNCICLLFVWLFLFYCCLRGIRSIAKVTYVTATFPVLLLLILLVRGVTLPGYKVGVHYFINPDWSKLSDLSIWASAATQAMYSIGVGFGSHIVLASYNKFHNNLFRDGVVLCIANTGTSLLCGFIVFLFIGHAADTLNKPISDVVDNGPGLIFISYIQGISQLPGSALWVFLFFTMVFTLGLDSLFVMVWTIYASIEDVFPSKVVRRKKSILLGICSLHFILGIPLVTDGGIHIVVMMDHYASNFSFTMFLLLESVAVCWIYGLKKFIADMELMVGKRFIWAQWYLRLTWMTTVPAFSIFIFIASAISYSPSSYNEQEVTSRGETIGLLIIVTPIIITGVTALIQVIRHREHRMTNVWKMVRLSTSESSSWGPRNTDDRVQTRYVDNIDIQLASRETPNLTHTYQPAPNPSSQSSNAPCIPVVSFALEDQAKK